MNYQIDLLYIPNLIVKLYVFIGVTSLPTCKILPVLGKATNNKNVEYNFLPICRYLKLVKIRG
jgi:hypothetical protein